MLSQYIGGIERNGTNHIVKAEASITAYGIKYNPVLNTAEGRLVSIYSHSFLNINTQTLQTDLHTFSYKLVERINFVKRFKYFPSVIILLILLTFSIDNVFV